MNDQDRETIAILGVTFLVVTLPVLLLLATVTLIAIFGQ